MTLHKQMTVLQESITHLEVRVTRLEKTLQKLVNKPSGNMNGLFSSQLEQPPQAQLINWLKNQGVIRTPTQEEEQLAAEWNDLPEQVKQEHVNFMQHLELDPHSAKLFWKTSVNPWQFITWIRFLPERL